MRPSIRCSELDRILSCPGSLALARIVAKRNGTEGDEGTDIHGKVAYRLSKELGATDQGFPVGFSYAPGKHITDWLVNFCFNAVKEGTPAGWSLETEIPLSEDFARFTLTGHPDVVAINPEVTEFYLDDFKTGYIPVDIAEMNWQLLAYAILLKKAYPTLQKGRLRIIQPRNDEDDGHPRISEVWLTNLDQAEAGLEARINAALDAPMDLDSGMSQCKWCPVAGPQCPVHQLHQTQMKLTMTPEALAKIKNEPDDATLGDWIVTARTLTRGTEDAEKLLHARLDSVPAIISGSGVQITRKITGGSYVVDNPVEFFKTAKLLLGTDERMAAVYKPSMTKLVEQVAEVLNIPKSGKAVMTGQSTVEASFKPFTTQQERRLLQFT